MTTLQTSPERYLDVFKKKTRLEISKKYSDNIVLDNIMSNVTSAKLTLIAARPGVGKSLFLVNVASYISHNINQDVLVFSIEEPSDGFIKKKLHKWYKSRFLIIDTPRLAVEHICKISTHLSNDLPYNFGLIIIDYYQLIKNHREDDALAKLNSLAQKLNIPILVTYLMSNSINIEELKFPKIEDLNNEIDIATNVDQVMILYREEVCYGSSERPNILDIDIYCKNEAE